MNKCKLVRDSCALVMSQAEHVSVNQAKLCEFADSLAADFAKGYKYIEFDEYDCHYQQFKTEADIVEYIFVLDTLNFCFWPSTVEFEYDNLAEGIKSMLLNHPTSLKPANLINIDRDFLKNNVFKGIEFPLLDERVRLLREIGVRTVELFDGEFINILKAAKNSAVKLLDLLTSNFNNFQDIAIYKGQQVCMYKRSQILIGDIYAALKGKGIGHFTDIAEITTFPDYRVPQILRHYGIMEYSKELTGQIDGLTQLPHGGQMEVEIRAATVQSVEDLKRELSKRGKELHSIEIDWILWQKGEEARKVIAPHHRTLSIFY